VLYNFAKVAFPFASRTLFSIAHTFNVVCNWAIIARYHLATTSTNAAFLQAILFLLTAVGWHSQRLVCTFIQICVCREHTFSVQNVAKEELFRSLKVGFLVNQLAIVP